MQTDKQGIDIRAALSSADVYHGPQKPESPVRAAVKRRVHNVDSSLSAVDAIVAAEADGQSVQASQNMGRITVGDSAQPVAPQSTYISPSVEVPVQQYAYPTPNNAAAIPVNQVANPNTQYAYVEQPMTAQPTRPAMTEVPSHEAYISAIGQPDTEEQPATPVEPVSVSPDVVATWSEHDQQVKRIVDARRALDIAEMKRQQVQLGELNGPDNYGLAA